MTGNPRLLPWLMWFLPLIFFAFQFILRLFPGLIISDFLEKYHITATDFGFFASLYYLGYASMQIPLALWLDKYGPRKVISASTLLCGLATWLFILFNSWPIALLSRFLIGVGSVVGFLGLSKVISLWFPKAHYTRLVGLSFSFGLLGALYGGRPISKMIAQMGWEKVNMLLGTAAILLALCIFCFLKEKEKCTEDKTDTIPICAKLKMLFSYKSLFILAFANFLMVGALEGFADVWGVHYLMVTRSLPKVDAASIVSFIFVGMLVGGPLLAYFSEKYDAHYFVTFLCGILMSLLLGSLLLFNIFLSDFWVAAIMFSIGVLCCYQVIVFAIGTQSVPTPLISLTVALLNCINMLGGSFFHTSMGRLMDYFEGPLRLSSSYSAQSCTYALTLIPLASLVGAGLIWWSKIQSQKTLIAFTFPKPHLQ